MVASLKLLGYDIEAEPQFVCVLVGVRTKGSCVQSEKAGYKNHGGVTQKHHLQSRTQGVKHKNSEKSPQFLSTAFAGAPAGPFTRIDLF